MGILMFLAPVFYPIEAAPAALRPWLFLNPLTFMVVQMRRICIWGEAPDWLGWLAYLAVGYGMAWLGLAWFNKSSKGFADVL